MTRKNVTTSVRIAVPCYGTRVLPRFGLAQEFVIADLDPSGRRFQTVRCLLRERCQTGPGAWLRSEGVQGVLCGGIHPRFQRELEAQGIWIVWGLRGEVSDVLDQWLGGDALPLQRIVPDSGVSPCDGRRRRRESICAFDEWQEDER